MSVMQQVDARPGTQVVPATRPRRPSAVTTKALLICKGLGFGSPEGHQVHGFDMYRDELAGQLGLEVERVQAWSFDEIDRAIQARSVDVVMVMISWREPAEEAIEFFRRLSERPNRPEIVFIDYYAPTCSPHFGVLPHVDRYVKRQVLRDRTLYQEDLEGGYIFTDYAAKYLGFTLNGWSFGSKPDPAHLHKLTVGWNLGVTPRYRKFLKATRPLAPLWDLRPFDINRRVGIDKSTAAREWYQEYRSLTLDRLGSLGPGSRCTGTGRIGRVGYFAEMAASKIVVSPFGWGELGFRDYEAVALGALLIKPSMEHLETSPNIFVPGETYVPVAWDGRDIAEKCRYYLDRPEQAKEIIRNAQRALADYYENHGFVEDIRRSLGLPGAPASRPRPVSGELRRENGRPGLAR